MRFLGHTTFLEKLYDFKLPAPPEPNGSPFELVLVGAAVRKRGFRTVGLINNTVHLQLTVHLPLTVPSLRRRQLCSSTGRFFEFAQRWIINPISSTVYESPNWTIYDDIWTYGIVSFIFLGGCQVFGPPCRRWWKWSQRTRHRWSSAEFLHSVVNPPMP